MEFVQHLDKVFLFLLASRNRLCAPLVVPLLGETQYPARHRHRHPSRGVRGGHLAHERVHHFGVRRFAYERYAAAQRSTSFSISNSPIRYIAAIISRRSPTSVVGVNPRALNRSSLTHIRNANFETPRSLHTCLCDKPQFTSATASHLNPSE